MQAIDPGSTGTALFINIVASALFALAVLVGERLYSRIAHRNPAYRKWRLLAIVSAWIVANIAVYAFLSGWPVFLLITSITLSVTLFNELNQFWQIGLVGADREVRGGIDYGTALGMCQHSFSFLGIGASKLTQNQKAFRDVIDRCNRATPVRLLLGRPDAVELERFAQMAGKDKDSYKRTVTESLRFIARLRNGEAKNISVRFYEQFPAFRLMFIDESICLMSYYIMGKGDGSNLPQLHVVKTPGSQDTQALYFGFAEYFEKIWNNSNEWDFKEFL